MARKCEYCGKHTTSGGQITRRGLAKKYGGVGSRVIANSKRKFRPNLKRVRASVDGVNTRVTVCTSCLQAGKVTKPVKRNWQPAA